MKLVLSNVNKIFETDQRKINTVVIENQDFLSEIVNDLYSQINGNEGDTVLSLDGKELPINKKLELIDRFIPFEINSKSITSKVVLELCNLSVSELHYDKCIALIGQLEEFLNEISFDLNYDLEYGKIDINSIIKMCEPKICQVSDSIAEKLLDYIGIVTELIDSKIFVLVNFRSFVNDKDAELFLESVILHGFHVIMLESREYPLLSYEERLIIDNDLCEMS